jgi:integrase
VDEFVETKRTEGGSLSTIACYAQALRAFFLYAEGHGWCRQGFARGIQKLTVPKYDTAPRGPKWGDVRRLLRYESKRTSVLSSRAHAILLLCSIYALRSSEVTGLRLIDIDWRGETFCGQACQARRLANPRLEYQFHKTVEHVL